jgi:predicted dehydrogenase
MLRLAVIGCGHFGQKRVACCRFIPNSVTLVAIGDSDINKARDVAKKYPGVAIKSISDILSDPTIEAVILAVPNIFHADLAVRALKHNKHVLLEKPIATTVKDAQRIVDASKKYGKLVKIGSNHRFFQPVKKAYELCQKGIVGKILAFHGVIGNDGTRIAGSWFWDKHTAGGGTYLDNGSHLIDIARMFMGDFSSCFGNVSNVFWKDASVEDYGTGTFITVDGRLATITASWFQKKGYINFELIGESGYILFNTINDERLIVKKRTGGKSHIYIFNDVSNTSYQDELSYFATCIKNGNPVNPSAQDGKKVLEMVQGIYSSSKQNKWIHL